MVGGGAAALAGLVFVAMSLNLQEIVSDLEHRYRAIATLEGFAGIFILSGFALMGEQNNLTIGIEWLGVSLLGAFTIVSGYLKTVTRGGRRSGLSLPRTIFGSACYLAQMVGSVLVILGYTVGVYIAAGSMMILFASL